MLQSNDMTLVFENFTTGVVIHNSKTEVIFSNSAALKILGLTMEQMLGKTAMDPHWRFIREDRTNLPLDEFPVTQVICTGKKIKSVVIGIMRSDRDSPVWALCNAHPEVDENNKLIQVIVNFTEITIQKRAETELKEMAARLQATYALANIGVWKWVVATDTVTWTEELYKISDIDPTLPPPSFAEMEKMHSQDSWVRLKAAVRNALETGEPYQLELEYVLKDCSLRNVYVYGGVKRDSTGKIIELYGSVQDTTEKERAEKKLKDALKAAEDASSIKSRFLDIAAHELRTPVSAFSLLLQLTQKKLSKGSPVEMPVLDRLLHQASRISQLVVQLLDVSRLERGALTIKLEMTDISSVINQCLEDSRLRSLTRKFIFLKPDGPIQIKIDKLRIYQVISNILDNALKYTPENTPIEISLVLDPHKVRVSIKDQGQGIGETLSEGLFAPFSRGSNALVEDSGGLGLGLYISHEIITLHGGTIGVTSKTGSGSTFYFELPIEIIK